MSRICIPYGCIYVISPMRDPYSPHMSCNTPSGTHKKPRCEISAQMRQVITIWAPYTVVWRASFWHGVESVIRIGLYACNYSVSLRPTFDWCSFYGRSSLNDRTQSRSRTSGGRLQTFWSRIKRSYNVQYTNANDRFWVGGAFRQKLPFISETVRDRPMVTMER